MHRLELFYDIVSPYSFLAFETLCRYRDRWTLDLDLRPFLLGGVMKATGNQPPATLPARGRFLLLDMQRNAEYFGVPLRMPSSFPMLTLQAMRLLTAVKQTRPGDLERLTRRLWQMYWSEDRDVSKPDVLAAALAEVGIEAATAAELLEATTDPAIKDALKTTTQVAIDRGAFGAPTMFLIEDGEPVEMYFGSDRFAHLAARLGVQWLGPQPG